VVHELDRLGPAARREQQDGVVVALSACSC
jgi:hypothetical protein